MSSPAQTELSGIRKAAILLVLLGDSVASTICDHLPQESLKALAEEISSIGEIPDDTANLVLKEYERMSGPKKAVVQGGPELQVAAFAQEDDARKLVEGLRQKNFKAFVRTLPVDSLFRVTVGPYADAASARTSITRLKKAGFKAFIRREVVLESLGIQ